MTAEVLVVHCVDTEGPLGGDARRLPDGSPEFFETWSDILVSLRELTAPDQRRRFADSFGDAYRFNWFIMDFTGFATNPKCRVAAYHDTWDHITRLPVEADGLYWHYHVPPTNGIGDQWSDTWLSSNECNTILARRLIERGSFPAAFRAGGTIEDEAASRWLEQTIPLDYSNRVSERSRPDADLHHFNWYGAPTVWGSYHPALGNPMRRGSLSRFIYRSIDLRSRYNELTQEHVDDCFREARDSDAPRVLSFFSHDNRDMRPETHHVVDLLRTAEERVSVPWRSCTAIDAHRRYHDFDDEHLELSLERDDRSCVIRANRAPFQRTPFVAARLEDGRIARLYAAALEPSVWRVSLGGSRVSEIAVAVTSSNGAVSIATVGCATPERISHCACRAKKRGKPCASRSGIGSGDARD